MSARRWLLLALLSTSAPALADPGAVALFGGMWGLRAHEPHEVAVQLEYRFGVHWWWVRPLGGLLLSSEGTQLLYAGVLLEVPLPWGILLAPGFAPGVRLVEGQRDLGSVVLFKSSVEVSFPLGPGIRAGLSFSHTSNARLGSHNPGIENLLLGLQIALQ